MSSDDKVTKRNSCNELKYRKIKNIIGSECIHEFNLHWKSLAAIEARLSQIENSLNLSHPSQPLSVNKNMNKPVPKPMSGNWLGIVASVCFILAAGFIIKLSIASGWLTHEKQLGLATLFGLALLQQASWSQVQIKFMPAFCQQPELLFFILPVLLHINIIFWSRSKRLLQLPVWYRGFPFGFTFDLSTIFTQ